jgi:hypothetical protein
MPCTEIAENVSRRAVRFSVQISILREYAGKWGWKIALG